MRIYKDELFCDQCGGNLALGTDSEIVTNDQGKEYIKRELYLYCSVQNCPQQFKRKALPQA